MKDREQLMTVIQAEAGKIDMVMRRDLDSLRPHLDPLLLEVLEYGLFNGGKRVRPLLVILCARLCGCQKSDVYDLARAFEYLHAATLFHDDVIDNALTRRGRPAVNRQFGTVAAILAGDFLHARSMHIVGEMAGIQGLQIFCQATAGMVDGEFMQLRNAAQLNLSEADYVEAIMGKTGLLIAASCEIGALYGGADVKQQQALRAYGVGIGCAFQMVDDLLDYTGSQQKTGKQIGIDLAEGKMTLPLIYALNKANDNDRATLKSILADERLRQQRLSEVIACIDNYDGFAETRKRAETTITDAVASLDLFTNAESAMDKAVLTGLAGYILTREK